MVSYRNLPVVKTLFSFEKKNLFDLFQKVKRYHLVELILNKLFQNSGTTCCGLYHRLSPNIGNSSNVNMSNLIKNKQILPVVRKKVQVESI